MKAVWIEWDDSCGYSGGPWHDQRDIKKTARNPMLIQQIGYLISEGKKHVLLCSGVDKNGRVCNPFRIPRGAIIRRWSLDHPEKK